MTSLPQLARRRSRLFVRFCIITLVACSDLFISTTIARDPKNLRPSIGRSDRRVRSVQIHEQNYNYLDEGTGPCIVLVHGSHLAEGIFERQIPALVNAGYRVVCPYLAGIGGSAISGPMTVQKDIEDTWILLDLIDVSRFVVGGHSGGTRHALHMLLERPQRILGIILIDGTYYLAGPASKLGRERMTPIAREGYDRYHEEFKAINHPFSYHNEYNLRLYKEWTAMDPAYYRKVTRPPIDRTLPKGIYCHVPMLVFASGWGKISNDDPEAAALRAALPADRATLHVVTEAGHFVQLEQSQIVNDKLIRFLDGEIKAR